LLIIIYERTIRQADKTCYLILFHFIFRTNKRLARAVMTVRYSASIPRPLPWNGLSVADKFEFHFTRISGGSNPPSIQESSNLAAVPR